MADNILIQQPNGEWATLRTVDIGGGVQVPVVQMQDAGYAAGSLTPLSDTQSAAAAVAAVDVGYARPFKVRAPITPASFGVRTVTLGAGSAFKIGIWGNALLTNRPTGLPLMFNDTGEPTTASNTNDQAPLSAGALLVPGPVYWCLAKWTGTLPSVVMCSNVDLFAAQIIGLGLGSSAAATITGLSTPLPYADSIVVDLTAAVWTSVLTTNMPLYVMGAPA